MSNPPMDVSGQGRLRRARESLGVWRRLVPHLSAHRGQLALVAGASLVVIGLEILRPWPLKWIFDDALMGTGDAARTPLEIVLLGALALASIMLTRSLVQYVVEMETTAIGHAVTRSLRHRIFEHLTRLSPTFHARHKSGDLLVRLMGDVPILRTMLVESTIAISTRALLILGTIAVMLSVDWVLTLVLVAFVPVFLICVRLLARSLTIAVRKQRRKEGALADLLHETISASSLIQSLGRSEHAVHRFARSNRRSVRAGLKAARLAARMSASVESLLGISLAAALGLGSWRVIQGHLSPGELLVFMSYVKGLLKPVRSASKHAEKVARGSACGERILAILDEPVDIASAPDAPPASANPRRLVFEHASFRYADGSRALDEFTATFERGELVGVFGRSGSGKSTFAALALRLFDPTSGAVQLDGHDLRELELTSLRERFGLCMQDAVLFGDTIRENLLLGQPDASDAALLAACEGAAIADVVCALPEQLDTRLGTSGAGLSGGERRRLCLARTLLRDAPVLIVDEPFAGLDRIAALHVLETLRTLSRQRIVIVIAHELDYLEAFDRVLFVEDGRVRGSGTHGELSERDAAYRHVTCVPRPALS